MNEKETFLSRLSKLPKEIKLLMLATFITNIGNGMYTIAVSKLVYDKTNSAMAFGGVMILQYVVMFFVQFMSGSIVDRMNPRFISIICDLISGFLVVSSGLMVLLTDIGLIYLFIAVIVLNIVGPFFGSANFSLMPAILKDKTQLLQVNSMVATLFQAGQLLGCALVAPVIFIFNPSIALIIDGITFLLSALLVSLTRSIQFEVKKDQGRNVAANLFNDWKEIVKAMRKYKSFAAHLFMASGDYLSINFFNLMLVPMVTQWYRNSFYISLYDGGFAIGAMIFVSFVVVLSKKIGVNNSAFAGILVQAILFILIIIFRNPIITLAVVFTFGAANSFSVAIFTTNLQERCNGPIRGRVGSLKSFIVSCFSIILIPIVSRLHDVSLTYGLAASAGILLVYAFLSFLFGRKVAFGKKYLTKAIETTVN